MEYEDREFAERVRSCACRRSPRIEAIYGIQLLRCGKTRWGDKTPGYLIEIDRLRQVFPNAKFIHLIRDARDVSLSLWRKGWFGPHLRNAARHWSESVRTGIEQGRLLPPGSYHEIRYEDLVRDRISSCAPLPVPGDRLRAADDAVLSRLRPNVAPGSACTTRRR